MAELASIEATDYRVMSAITMQLESMVARDLSSNRNSTRRQTGVVVTGKRRIAVLEQRQVRRSDATGQGDRTTKRSPWSVSSCSTVHAVLESIELGWLSLPSRLDDFTSLRIGPFEFPSNTIRAFPTILCTIRDFQRRESIRTCVRVFFFFYVNFTSRLIRKHGHMVHDYAPIRRNAC